MKTKLLKDLNKREKFMFSVDELQFVPVERDKYYRRESEFLQWQINLLDIAAKAQAKVDDKWTINPFATGKRGRRDGEKNFVQLNIGS